MVIDYNDTNDRKRFYKKREWKEGRLEALRRDNYE